MNYKRFTYNISPWHPDIDIKLLIKIEWAKRRRASTEWLSKLTTAKRFQFLNYNFINSSNVYNQKKRRWLHDNEFGIISIECGLCVKATNAHFTKIHFLLTQRNNKAVISTESMYTNTEREKENQALSYNNLFHKQITQLTQQVFLMVILWITIAVFYFWFINTYIKAKRMRFRLR